MSQQQSGSQLTSRQDEILLLISKGLTNKEIAELLNLSVNTIKTHVSASFLLLGASNRAEAISLYKAHQQQYDGMRLLKLSVKSFNHETDSLKDDFEKRLLDFDFFELSDQTNVDYLLNIKFKAGKYHLSLYHSEHQSLLWQATETVLKGRSQLATAIELTHLIIHHCIKHCQPSNNEQGYLHFYHGVGALLHDSPQKRVASLLHIQQASTVLPDVAVVQALSSLIEYRNLIEAPQTTNTASTITKITLHAKTALSLKKTCCWSHLSMAVNHFINRNVPESIEHAKAAVALNQANYMALRFLAQMYALNGQHTLALETIDRALEVYPSLHWQGVMMSAKALVHFALKDYTSCISFCQRSTDFIESSLLNHLVWIVSLAATDQQGELKRIVDTLPTFNTSEYQRLLAMLPGDSISQFTDVLHDLSILPKQL
ncbi:hypothetical protein SOPP22_13835 [Shewanella sp. OPT22]|nr:hypothetical protein SOPP22_13835 [Shewanella sp. OPT22]